MASFPALAAVQKHPVEHAILGFAQGLQDLREQLPQEVVIRRLFEAKLADVVHVNSKLLCDRQFSMLVRPESRGTLTGEAFAELFDGGALLLLADLFVLLLVGRSTKTLPGQSATQEVHEDMSKGLKVITTRLLASQVGVDGHVPGSTGQRFPLAVWYMHLGLRITVVLSHTEI